MKQFFAAIRSKCNEAAALRRNLLRDERGDLSTNTIGGIIIAVVIIGLMIAAINAFFPGFFTSMFTSMAQKLNANW